MKIAQLSLPRSRSECLFNTLAPIAERCGMEIYYPEKGNYYYIDNDAIHTNMFCKIDTRTPFDRFERIVEEFKEHTWWVSTRDFEDFCLSFSYAMTSGQFHDLGYREYESFEITYDHYKYAVEIYNKFHEMAALLSDPTWMYYDKISGAGNTQHHEKDYKKLCTNYDQFRDWQRVDYIMGLKWTRKWNCYSSFDEKDLQEHELFSDIVEGKCQMWYNVYKPGDSQDWHSHDGVKSCGTRFLQLPTNSGKMCFKGWNQKNIQHTQVEFGPEDKHRVTENRSEDYRITVSWNVK